MTHKYRASMKNRLTKKQYDKRLRKRFERKINPRYKLLPIFNILDLLTFVWQWVDFSKAVNWVPVKA